MSDMRDFNQGIIEEFRANDGKVGGGFEGSPMVLLTTTGAKSKTAHTNPLVCQPGVDGAIYVFASKGGAPSSPDWYYNLLAHPEVEVEYGTERFSAVAEPLEGAARDEIFNRQKEVFPAFADYEKATTRTIPVIKLSR
jgi:deazaflavin-dependent oxidoreductase (nitroreductase family)